MRAGNIRKTATRARRCSISRNARWYTLPPIRTKSIWRRVCSTRTTHFLPFNRGSHPGEVQCGAGNPQHPSGYRTGYFWEEVLQRDSFLDILGHFMFVEKQEEKVDDGRGGQRRIIKERMIFPRYHQLDAVRKLVAAARARRCRQNYLIQHSAGSGKTNSISWLSHRLASLHDAQDRKVFDCVIVVTDRRVLDRAAPGRDLSDRARAGRGEGDRPGLEAARRGADRRH